MKSGQFRYNLASKINFFLRHVASIMNDWHGKLICLRGIEPSDAETFFRWNQDGERARLMDFLWPPTSRAQVEAWAQDQSLRKLEGGAYHWLIENKDGVPVGSISTHDCNPRNGTFSYGIDIDPAHRRQGYASEAIRMVCRYYFEELRYQKVTIPVHADNPASIELHEALGFQREGVHRRMIHTQGGYVDELWYGLTREEFLSGEKFN
jgi:RimJ/RimL family protein N-acetyltransferase